MKKVKILGVIALASMVMMACSIGGFTQQKMEAQPTATKSTEHTAPTLDTPTVEQPLLVEEIQTIITPLPTEEIEVKIQTEPLPTPTVDPLLSAKTCMAKTWQINGLSDYVIAAVPPELAKEYSLEYVDTTGQAYLTLSPDGKIVLNADQLVFNFNARLAIFQVPVTVSIDGAAVGSYTIDGSSIKVSSMDTSGLSASAQALNEDLMDSNQIINAIPFIRPPFNKAAYACQGDTLELELSGYPANIPPLVFTPAK